MQAIRRWRNPLLWLLISLALFVLGRSSLLRDPGTFWHTVLGQRMVIRGELVRDDFFTFTRASESWLALQWLPEIAMGIGHWLGGWDLLLATTCFGLGWLYARLLVRWLDCGLHPLAAAFLAVIVLLASSHHFHVRPHLVTIGLLALSMAILVDCESGRAPPARLSLLAPLFVLWTNCHGGVLAGIATLVIVGSGWACLAWRRSDETARYRVLGLWGIAISAICGLAMLINPYGAEMPVAWARIMTMRLPNIIEEHAPLDWAHGETWGVVVLGGLYCLALFTAERPLRATWLVPLVWWALAWTRVRHAPLFAVVTAIALADLLPHTRLSRWLKPGDWFRDPTPSAGSSAHTSPAAWLVACGLMVVVLLGPMLGWQVPLAGRGWAQHAVDRWPVELVRELQSIERQHPGARLYNSLGLGGFVEFHAPGLRTMIDDRCELFGNEFLERYVESERGTRGHTIAWADDWHCQFALVPQQSPQAEEFRNSSHWRLRAAAISACLFERCPFPENCD
jgi:hypothetical protein